MPEPVTAQVPPPSGEQLIVAPTPARNAGPARTSSHHGIDLVAEYDLDDDGQFDDETNPDPLAAANGRPTPAPQPAPQQPPAPGHSKLVARLARDLGVSDADLADASPEEAERLVAALHEQRAATRLTDQIARTPTPARPQEPAQPTAPQSPREAPPAAEEFDLGLSEEEFDPALLAALKKLHGHFAAQVAELRQGLTGLTQIEGRRQAQTAAEQIDAGFADSGLAGTLGEGGRADLREGDPALDRRMAVLHSLQRRPGTGALRAQVAERARELFGTAGPAEPQTPAPGAPAAPRRRPVQHPVTGHFTGEFEEVPDEQAARQDAWSRAGLARPTSREHPPEPKGDRRAAKAVAAFQQSNGFGEPRSGLTGDEEGDLPD